LNNIFLAKTYLYSLSITSTFFSEKNLLVEMKKVKKNKKERNAFG
jgi:hypothetical protein